MSALRLAEKIAPGDRVRLVADHGEKCHWAVVGVLREIGLDYVARPLFRVAKHDYRDRLDLIVSPAEIAAHEPRRPDPDPQPVLTPESGDGGGAVDAEYDCDPEPVMVSGVDGTLQPVPAGEAPNF